MVVVLLAPSVATVALVDSAASVATDLVTMTTHNTSVDLVATLVVITTTMGLLATPQLLLDLHHQSDQLVASASPIKALLPGLTTQTATRTPSFTALPTRDMLPTNNLTSAPNRLPLTTAMTVKHTDKT